MSTKPNLERFAVHVAAIPPCGVAKAFAEMDEQARADFTGAFDADDVQTARIVDELHKDGFAISETTVRRHRTGMCACGR